VLELKVYGSRLDAFDCVVCVKAVFIYNHYSSNPNDPNNVTEFTIIVHHLADSTYFLIQVSLIDNHCANFKTFYCTILKEKLFVSLCMCTVITACCEGQYVDFIKTVTTRLTLILTVNMVLS